MNKTESRVGRDNERRTIYPSWEVRPAKRRIVKANMVKMNRRIQKELKRM
jgi:hypothetical protein